MYETSSLFFYVSMLVLNLFLGIVFLGCLSYYVLKIECLLFGIYFWWKIGRIFFDILGIIWDTIFYDFLLSSLFLNRFYSSSCCSPNCVRFLSWKKMDGRSFIWLSMACSEVSKLYVDKNGAGEGAMVVDSVDVVSF